MDSEQKVAVITGASGGIGAALVDAYRDRNYRVVATARSMEPLSGDDVMVVSGDIADRKTAERAISEGMARFGRIDTLVNNAGIFIAKPFTEPGDNPQPVCLVGLELRSDRKVRLWYDEFGPSPPYSTGSDTLFVAYYASAEIGCHLALGWPVPERTLDLFTEFRNASNGLPTPSGSGLIGALVYHGLDAIGADKKHEMRELVLRGGPWTPGERTDILDYCESDVDALARLVPVMLPGIDLPRALLRGRYMAAAARIERAGVPIDTWRQPRRYHPQDQRENGGRLRTRSNGRD